MQSKPLIVLWGHLKITINFNEEVLDQERKNYIEDSTQLCITETELSPQAFLLMREKNALFSRELHDLFVLVRIFMDGR